MRGQWFAALLACVLALAAPSAAPAGTPAGAMSAPGDAVLSKQAFADRFLAALKAAAPQLKVTAKSVEEYEVAQPGGETGVLNLANVYQDYTDDPELLDELIGRMVRVVIAASSTDQDFEASRVLILLRPEAYVEGDPKFRDQPDRRQVFRPFAGDLFAVIGADMGESIFYPNREDLRKKFPGSEDALWKRALENTRKILAGRIKLQDDGEGIVSIFAPGLASGVLLDDSFWERPEFKGKGDLVALVTKDEVLVVHEGNAAGLKLLRDYIADEQAADRYLLSAVLLVRRNGKWEVLRS